MNTSTSATDSSRATPPRSEATTTTRLMLVDTGTRPRALDLGALEHAGFEVVTAGGTAQAISLFRQSRPAVVLIDAAPSWGAGHELCSLVRAEPVGAQTPILFVIERDDGDAIAAACQAGATDVVTTPIHYPLLARRAELLVRSYAVYADARRSASRLSRARRFMKLAQWELDPEVGQFRWSEEARKIYGLPIVEASLDEALLCWVALTDRDAVARAIAAGEHAIEYRLRCPDGRDRIVHQVAEVVIDPIDGRRLVVGATEDVTKARATERAAQKLAYFDSLTRLPNRAFLRHFLEHALAHARRQRGCAAVLALDLDGFKRVNDTLGHAGGDELLREVARRITGSVRACDSVSSSANEWDGGSPTELCDDQISVAARLGGDEFVVVLTHLRRPEDAAIVARRIAEQLAVGVRIGNTEVFVSSSIGIASFPENAGDVDTLLAHADAAMYQAKDSGRNRFHFYTASMQERARAQMDLENSLRSALARARIISARSSFSDDAHCEFHLVYQPKVAMPGCRVSGMEALIRWSCPTRGLVAPSDFIPLAEHTGLIVPLGAWVLRTACEQAKRLAAREAPPLRVAVNVSSRQLRERGFAEFVAATLAETGLDPTLLELEITEGIVMEDTAASFAVLAEMRALGVRIALDDFGTGYSSLSYLTRLPIDALKIDRSFVQGAACPGGAAKVTAAIISLARSLGIDVVIEGVESEEQLDAVTGEGPVEVQGFLFARPMPPAELEPWLEIRERAGIPDDPKKTRRGPPGSAEVAL